jgi:hypothetical protein
MRHRRKRVKLVLCRKHPAAETGAFEFPDYLNSKGA